MERVDVGNVPPDDATQRRIGNVWTKEGIVSVDLTGGNWPRYVVVGEKDYKCAQWRNGEPKVFRARRSQVEFLAYYPVFIKRPAQPQEAPNEKATDEGTGEAIEGNPRGTSGPR